MMFCSNRREAVMVRISSFIWIRSPMVSAVWFMIGTRSPPLRFATRRTRAKLRISSTPARSANSSIAFSTGIFMETRWERSSNSRTMYASPPSSIRSSRVLSRRAFSMEYPADNAPARTDKASRNCRSRIRFRAGIRALFRKKGYPIAAGRRKRKNIRLR